MEFQGSLTRSSDGIVESKENYCLRRGLLTTTFGRVCFQADDALWDAIFSIEA